MCIKVSGILSRDPLQIRNEPKRETREKVSTADDTEYIVFSKVLPVNT